MDDQGCRAVRARLDADDEQHEGCKTPAPEGEERDEAGTHHHGYDDASGQRRADPGQMLERRVAVVGQPSIDALVPRREPSHRQQQLGQHEAQADHDGEESCIPEYHGSQEDCYRPLCSDAPREGLCPRFGPWLE